jgi:hypothetical protein
LSSATTKTIKAMANGQHRGLLLAPEAQGGKVRGDAGATGNQGLSGTTETSFVA